MGCDPKLGRGVLWFGSAEPKWVAWVADRIMGRGPKIFDDVFSFFLLEKKIF